ncbi:MAG: glycosyltransferase family 2 protein [Deltaproteobacteria bacterium]|nr:glycosyltransferase family 2 protein [Deltaproteobacteria bacterium]
MTAADLLSSVLLVTDGVILVYFTVYFSLNLGMLALAFRAVRRRLRVIDYSGAPDPGPFPPVVSLLAPAYNEEVTVVPAVTSLLKLDYPSFEIVIINDGSKDRTVEVLRRAFGFRPAVAGGESLLPTAQVRGVFVADPPEGSRCSRFVLVDKENGGKADALNAGINEARGAFVCSMDADSLILPHALKRIVQPLLDAPDDLVALGVQVAASNGCTVSDGRLVDVKLPRSLLARVQVVEYLRSFTQSRLALGQLNLLLVLSGVFAAFRRDLLVEIGGFLTKSATSKAVVEYCGRGSHTVCEDMEVIVRLHRWLRDRGRVGRVEMLPEPLAWTEVPENFTFLGKQRARWQRGLFEVLWLHRGMFFEKRFGAVGRVSLPYQLLFEAITPLIEAFGVIVVPLTVVLGVLDWRVFVLFLGLAVAASTLLSIGSMVVATWAEPARLPGSEDRRLFPYDRAADLASLFTAALVENVGYRQVLLYWRLRGTWDWLRGRQAWDKFARKGFGDDVMPQMVSGDGS